MIYKNNNKKRIIFTDDGKDPRESLFSTDKIMNTCLDGIKPNILEWDGLYEVINKNGLPVVNAKAWAVVGTGKANILYSKNL